MRRLETIQKKENLNKVFAADKFGPGGANHEYHIVIMDNKLKDVASDMIDIKFQKGARNEVGSQHGVIDTDLLEIVRDRLKCFQAGPFASKYNANALYHIEEALHAMNARVEDRIKRNVLGTYSK
ncbi:MAG: ABC transporter ATPase [Clostridium perfringens]|uniref:ABC transporter ATPase n=1 Tax=Clostridium perfringens TaxID=1502 RepID=UPI002915C157|nr:ABC transporter ATPase [Clostridium perfringens]